MKNTSIACPSIESTMTDRCCTNELCIKRDTQLRLIRLREELLNNFNTILIDRIRFLEQTIHRLSLVPPPSSVATASSSTSYYETYSCSKPIKTNRLKPPPQSTPVLRRSSSAEASFLVCPTGSQTTGPEPSPRSCPSSVDLSSGSEQRRRSSSEKKSSRTQQRNPFKYDATYLSIPSHRAWASSADNLTSSANLHNEKGRLESRRFACDVDDNDVRAFKAMVYMEQARKQHTRPLTRLCQALGISNTASTGNFTSYNPKKQTNV